MRLTEILSEVSDSCLAEDSGERAEFAACLLCGTLDADLDALAYALHKARTVADAVQCLQAAPHAARLWWLETLHADWCGDMPYYDPNASREEAADRGRSNAEVRRGIDIGWRILNAFGITPEAR